MEIPPPDALKKAFCVPEKTLMGPGPSNASNRVLNAMSQQIIGHLHPECMQLMDDIKAGIKYIFQTQNEATMCLSASGHAGMEMALCNLIEHGTVVLIGITGYWGNHATGMATRHGAKVYQVEAPLGEALTLDQIKTAFEKYEPKVFFVVQGESSTGVLQTHLREFGEFCRSRDCLFVVDTVASLGGTEFYMDAWSIDVAFTGSQKVLGAAPCITPISFNDRAIRFIQARKSIVDVYYMDALLIGQCWGCYGWSRIYHHTLSSTLLVGLREALAQFCEEGIRASIERHKECSTRLQQGIQDMGLKLFVKIPEYRLPTVNTVEVPEGLDWKRVTEYSMKNYSLELSGGLGPTVNKVFRIGVMGLNATPEKIKLALKVLKEALENAQVVASKI